jgi:DinB family protein
MSDDGGDVMAGPDPSALLTAARAELARTPDVVAALVAGLDPPGWRARPAPAEWAPVEIVCHLRDEEAEDFGARLRVVIEGGAAFAAIDPERWARERRYREDDGPRALALFRDRRTSTLALLGSTAAARLTASVAHPRTGALSGLDLLAAWVEHDRLHLAQLAATLARLWATRWVPLHTEYAGPIPYATT